MRLRKSYFILPVLSIVLFSCSQDLDTTILTRTALPMEGAQEVPAKNTAANGTLDIAYNKNTKTLSYTVKWNSLTGPIVGFHIRCSNKRIQCSHSSEFLRLFNCTNWNLLRNILC